MKYPATSSSHKDNVKHNTSKSSSKKNYATCTLNPVQLFVDDNTDPLFLAVHPPQRLQYSGTPSSLPPKLKPSVPPGHNLLAPVPPFAPPSAPATRSSNPESSRAFIKSSIIAPLVDPDCKPAVEVPQGPLTPESIASTAHSNPGSSEIISPDDAASDTDDEVLATMMRMGIARLRREVLQHRRSQQAGKDNHCRVFRKARLRKKNRKEGEIRPCASGKMSDEYQCSGVGGARGPDLRRDDSERSQREREICKQLDGIWPPMVLPGPVEKGEQQQSEDMAWSPQR